jgi:hypothetical protein
MKRVTNKDCIIAAKLAAGRKLTKSELTDLSLRPKIAISRIGAAHPEKPGKTRE